MDVFHNLPQHLTSHPCVVTIGNFDGLHRGHRALIQEVCRHANREHVLSTVVTFEPHPSRFFKPHMPPFRLTTLGQKVRGLRELGVDRTLVVNFDATLAAMQPDEFITHVLVEGLRARHVIVGYDFSFGRGAKGSIDDLIRHGKALGAFTAATFGPVLDQDDVVSSSRIRRAIHEGDLEEAERLMTAPFALHGTVVHGQARGRALGFPTANIHAPLQLTPQGVYVTTLVRLGSSTRHPAIANIGTRPTFHDEDDAAVVIEAFLLEDGLSPDLNLYGEEVELQLLHKIRNERTFERPDQLITQIRQDVAHARRHHGLSE